MLLKYEFLLYYFSHRNFMFKDENSSPIVVTQSYPLRTICQNNLDKPIELSTYLDNEDETNQLHEYLNGYVYALPLRENIHELFLKNLSKQIEEQKLSNLHILPMDIRIQTPDPTYIYYPGLCLSNQPAKIDQAITREPIVIIELLTPTTERLILHEKSINYQRIPTLKQIIYIWPNLKIAHVDFRDGESTKWTRKYYNIQDKIPLVQLNGNGELLLDEIFNNMVSHLLKVSNFIKII